MGTQVIDHKDGDIVTEALLECFTSGKLPEIVGRVQSHLCVHQACQPDDLRRIVMGGEPRRWTARAAIWCALLLCSPPQILCVQPWP